MRGQGSLDQFGVHPPEPVPVSTTTTVTAGSASNLRTFARDPFTPDPTSASTLTTGSPASAAQADSRATCPSRLDFWSCEDTRAYKPALSAFRADPAAVCGDTG